MATALGTRMATTKERAVWMSVNGNGATAPKLTDAELNALREFWNVYESQFAEVGARLAEDAAGHPELASFVGAGDAHEVAESRDRIAQAINEGDWEGYLSDMVASGARFAEAGLDFSAWFGTGRALRSRLVPLLVDALAAEPKRQRRRCAACRSSSTS